MKIVVNSKAMEFPDNSTILDIIQSLSIKAGQVVVEKNQSEIISRSKFQDSVLKDGDQIEILNFVGGG